MATSIANKNKPELKTKEELSFKELVNIWFFQNLANNQKP